MSNHKRTAAEYFGRVLKLGFAYWLGALRGCSPLEVVDGIRRPHLIAIHLLGSAFLHSFTFLMCIILNCFSIYLFLICKLSRATLWMHINLINKFIEAQHITSFIDPELATESITTVLHNTLA